MLLERLRTTLHKEINLTSTPERISKHCLHYFVQRPRHVFEESQANLQDLVINSVHQHLHSGPKKAVCYYHLLKGFAKNTHLSDQIKGVYRAGAQWRFPMTRWSWMEDSSFFLEYLRNNMKQANCGTQMVPVSDHTISPMPIIRSFLFGGQSAKNSIWLNLILLVVKSSWGKSASRH